MNEIDQIDRDHARLWRGVWLAILFASGFWFEVSYVTGWL